MALGWVVGVMAELPAVAESVCSGGGHGACRRVEAQVPVGSMNQPVMMTTQQHQVVQICRPAP